MGLSNGFSIQVTGIDLHPQHLLHRLLIEAALEDAPPLCPLLAAWEDLAGNVNGTLEIL